MPDAENDTHMPTVHNGRIVCCCGDFNCASLDSDSVNYEVIEDRGRTSVVRVSSGRGAFDYEIANEPIDLRTRPTEGKA